jgi:hypothetical protein
MDERTDGQMSRLVQYEFGQMRWARETRSLYPKGIPICTREKGFFCVPMPSMTGKKEEMDE